jgi:hypothetical protein
MKKVKLKLVVEKECEVPDNCTSKDLIDQSKKIKKILDMGYHVEVKIIEIKDHSSH